MRSKHSRDTAGHVSALFEPNEWVKQALLHHEELSRSHGPTRKEVMKPKEQTERL